MIIEKIPLKQIKPAKYNPRKDLKPGDPEYERLKNSLKEWDLVEPLIWNKRTGNLVGGHQRLKIIKERGDMEVEVSVVDLDDANEKALNIALNKISGDWDNALLLPLLEEVKLAGLDVELTGFSAADISVMNKKEVQEDDFDAEKAAEAIKEPITKMGDIWILGKHKLICADATDSEAMNRLMDGRKADLLITDPPYGVSYGDKNKFLNAISRGNHIQEPIKNDHKTVPEMNELWMKAFTLMNEHCKSGASYYVCSPQGGELMMMMMSLQKAGWLLKHSIIWVKNNHVLGRSDYHYKHEPILYGWKEGAGHNFYGGSGKFSTWFFDKPTKSDLHPTMKPLALMAEAINNSSKGEDIIIDWFSGSGSTMMACEQTGRIAYCAELDEKYCDVICQRFEKLTNIKPHKLEA